MTESMRTLDRLRLRVSLSDAEIAARRAKALELIASLHVVDVDQVVLESAAQPMPTELGTLDAIHLATALLWRDTTEEPLTMATHDAALAIAAEAHGLPVVGAGARTG
jgi:predicted nucleic acid-binding protein